MALTETVAFDDLSEEISSPVGKRRRETTSNRSSNVGHKSSAFTEGVSEGKAQKSREYFDKLGPVDCEKAKNSPLPLTKHTRVISKSSPEKCSIEAASKSEVNLAPNSTKIIKSYYPSIYHDFAQLGTTDQHPVATLLHKDTLVKLVTDVCQTEISGLQHYSGQNKGREAVISFLSEILSKLPMDVAESVDISTIFFPELTAEEERERVSLEEHLDELKMQSLELLKYENDITEFGTRYNSWVHGASDHGKTDRTAVSHKVALHQYWHPLEEDMTNFAAFFSLPVDVGYIGASSPIRRQTAPTKHQLSEPHESRSAA